MLFIARLRASLAAFPPENGFIYLTPQHICFTTGRNKLKHLGSLAKNNFFLLKIKEISQKITVL